MSLAYKQESQMSTDQVKLGYLYAEIVSSTTCRASMRVLTELLGRTPNHGGKDGVNPSIANEGRVLSRF